MTRRRSELEREMGNWREIPQGTVVYGTFSDVYFPGYRPGYAWRCGDCRMAGVNYLTEAAALEAADKHTGRHPGSVAEAAIP
jgi:hypothetical protein